MIMIMIMMMMMMMMMMTITIIAKRWTNEPTFSFVTQGRHAMSWRTELRKAMRIASTAARPVGRLFRKAVRTPPAFVCHGDCHQPHHLDAHLHFRGLFRRIFEVCSAFEVVRSTPSQDVCPGSSVLKVQPNDFVLALFLEVFGRLVVSYISPT